MTKDRGCVFFELIDVLYHGKEAVISARRFVRNTWRSEIDRKPSVLFDRRIVACALVAEAAARHNDRHNFIG